MITTCRQQLLYDLFVQVESRQGDVLDGFRKRIGIRKIEFVDGKGFYLNGKKFEGKLMGGNRHQDIAYLGNALPNNTHYRDAKKLRDAGMRIIRSAHYPQDPAFMDACDELGLFVIVATPGWQFWPKEQVSLFENRVYFDIRQMVRQYRNNPSVIMWEPILNETHYPDRFAKNVHNVVHEEYPYQGAYTACDERADGSQYFDVLYGMPQEGSEKCFYTREWGDNVDDWSSHNSPSRAAREWGEKPQLVQAFHYSLPVWYKYYNYDRLYEYSDQHVGGTLWHSFDHQRGYHPDPFFGGIMDAIRQPKYSYEFFTSQRPAEKLAINAESGPMIFIAHEMTPFSEPDVLVFSNCEEARLIFCEKDTFQLKADHEKFNMPHPYYLFEDVFKFMDVKKLHRQKRFNEASMVAEGIIDGEVVARHVRFPAKRKSQINLTIDNENMDLIADGSDVVPVIASICDQDGNVKRLNNDFVEFEVSGEGVLIGDGMEGVNPVKVEWGTAPVLIKSTNKAGEITVKASLVYEGKMSPMEATLTFNSVENMQPSMHSEVPTYSKQNFSSKSEKSTEELEKRIRELESELLKKELQEVEKQQEEFDTGVDK